MLSLQSHWFPQRQGDGRSLPRWCTRARSPSACWPWRPWCWPCPWGTGPRAVVARCCLRWRPWQTAGERTGPATSGQDDSASRPVVNPALATLSHQQRWWSSSLELYRRLLRTVSFLAASTSTMFSGVQSCHAATTRPQPNAGRWRRPAACWSWVEGRTRRRRRRSERLGPGTEWPSPWPRWNAVEHRAWGTNRRQGSAML